MVCSFFSSVSAVSLGGSFALPPAGEVFPLLKTMDWVIFFLILGLTVMAALWGLKLREKVQHGSGHGSGMTRNQASWVEYLLMGRKLTLPLFVATLVSTWYGKIFGVTQIAFEKGVYCFVTQGIFWYISYGLFALIMVKRIRCYGVLTMPELLEKLMGPGPAKVAAVLVFLKTLPVVYAISVGIFLKFLFGLPFHLATALGLVFVILYSLLGGFRAVVFSDMVQFVVMYLALGCVVFFSVTHFGGLSYLKTHLPPTHFQCTGEFSVFDTCVWFFIAFSTTFLNPAFYQRCLAAVSTKAAVWGIGVSTIFWIGFDLCQLLVGLYAKAAFPQAESLDICLHYALQILPSGYRGFFLAEVLATILSTLDSFLLISSAIVSYDLPLFSRKASFKVHGYTLLLTGGVTFLISLSYDGHIESLWKIFKGTFAACLLVPFIWSLLRPHTLKAPVFMGMVCGVCFSMGLWSLWGGGHVDAFYVGTLVSLVILGGSEVKRLWFTQSKHGG